MLLLGIAKKVFTFLDKNCASLPGKNWYQKGR